MNFRAFPNLNCPNGLALRQSGRPCMFTSKSLRLPPTLNETGKPSH
jgi:hypothetical protein